jgi:hypothetical protein
VDDAAAAVVRVLVAAGADVRAQAGVALVRRVGWVLGWVVGVLSAAVGTRAGAIKVRWGSN